MVESLQAISNHIHSQKRQKYTSEQLRDIESVFSSFRVSRLYDSKGPEIEQHCKQFFGSEKMSIQLTSAQNIYNNTQHLGKMLIFDLRSRMNYHDVHLKDSISFPIDLCDEDFFIRWDPNYIQSNIIKNKEKLSLFKSRKRLYVQIIVAQNDI